MLPIYRKIPGFDSDEKEQEIRLGCMNTVVFIGHGTVYRLDEDKLKNVIKTAIDNGADLFLNGGMGDFDYICARIVKSLQNEYPQIRSELVIPYLTFKPRSMDCFDSSVYPDGFEKYHFKAAIIARNKWMVNQSQIAICYVDHDWGGAIKTFEYAVKKGLAINNIGSFTYENPKQEAYIDLH